jgi:proteasome assembly chaperone 3
LQIQVPLTTASPTSFETALPAIPGTDTLPASHITPKTLLGGGGEDREAMGHMIASQIASMILTRDPEEQRTIIVGLGMSKARLEREGWFDLLELLGKVV